MRTKQNSNVAIKATWKLLMLAVLLMPAITKAQNNAEMGQDSTDKRDQFRHAINMCPGGIALGIFSVNYEHLFAPKHGLMFRLDYEMVPKTYSAAKIDADGMAVILNYRYHIGGGLNSYYLGAFSRYRIFNGEGSLEGNEFDFDIPDFTLGMNAGKRWVWKSGFTMNFALGYGYQVDGLNINNNGPGVEDAIDVFRNEYDFMSGFLGEFSIGYAF